MSIENLLTLGVAVVLLAVAALLRLLVVGGLRLFLKLSGTEIARSQTGRTPSPRQGRPVARSALNGSEMLGRNVVTLVATLGAWLAVATRTVARRAGAAYAWLNPRVAAAAKAGLSGAAARLKTLATVGAATAQHIARAISQLVRHQVVAKALRQEAHVAPAEEPQEARVIRLDREWDPLTDPLEDQPVSSLR